MKNRIYQIGIFPQSYRIHEFCHEYNFRSQQTASSKFFKTTLLIIRKIFNALNNVPVYL